MVDKRITDLAAASALAGTEVFEGVQGGASKKVTADQIIAVFKALYDANTVLAADTDNTPAAVTMAASTTLARLAAGNTKAASVAEMQTLYDVLTTALGIPKSLVDAKGDLLTATADNTPARLAVGANASRLVANSAASTGLEWAPSDLGYAQATANQTGVGTSATDLTTLTVTVTVGARPVVVRANVGWQKLTASGFVTLEIYDSTAAAIVQRAVSTQPANGYGHHYAEVRLAPAAGVRTYKLRALAENNTCDILAGATYPNYIQVVEA